MEAKQKTELALLSQMSTLLVYSVTLFILCIFFILITPFSNSEKYYGKFVFILWRVDPLLGNDSKMCNHTAAIIK
jgi:hypothetical protein